ncbi:MAG: AAA family ATPase [Deltaproteobacteria bacterium]|nr:AAA family ATPase [Deltaproteobacteria bacterium]
MLIQFSVENFASFRDRAVLTMLATGPEAGSADARYVTLDDTRLVKCAALYGANAAGKSNLVDAFRFVKGLVLHGTRPDEPIAATFFPFRLDASSASRPSRFQVDFFCGGTHHTYAFAVTLQAVEEERLSRVDAQGREELLFERTPAEIVPAPVLGGDAERQQFIRFVAQGTRPNQLFLCEAAERNVHELSPVIDWFRRSLTVLGPGARPAKLPLRLEREAELRAFAGDLLRLADTGIVGVRATREPLEVSSEDVEAVKRGTLDLGLSDGESLDLSEPDGGPQAVRISLEHLAAEGARVELEWEVESHGTRRFLHLAPLLYARLRPKDQADSMVLVIDELERSLHPLLTRLFIQRLVERQEGALDHVQLVFATHDASLLEQAPLAREGVWFVEKDAGGASHLYSLAEFKGEQLEHLKGQLGRGYLDGRFGAVPFLGDRGPRDAH